MEAADVPEAIQDIEQGPHFAVESEPEQFQAWEQVDVGRYMPRRVRGSCRGRALG